ncbi:hypothetical protein [Burkholderia ambifaria]|nr:hypothetical protein [Burkholderia ambifaria]
MKPDGRPAFFASGIDDGILANRTAPQRVLKGQARTQQLTSSSN